MSSKKERRALRQKLKEERQRSNRGWSKQQVLIWGGVSLVGLALIIGLVATGGLSSKSAPKEDIVSERGIHWHPELEVYVKGVKQEIPANIGIGEQYSESEWYDPMMQMTDVHTHDNSGTLHWEVMDNMAPVTKDHVKLGNIFEIWGKKFDGTPAMTVNGKPNSELMDYLVKDKDKIVIRYE